MMTHKCLLFQEVSQNRATPNPKLDHFILKQPWWQPWWRLGIPHDWRVTLPSQHHAFRHELEAQLRGHLVGSQHGNFHRENIGKQRTTPVDAMGEITVLLSKPVGLLCDPSFCAFNALFWIVLVITTYVSCQKDSKSTFRCSQPICFLLKPPVWCSYHQLVYSEYDPSYLNPLASRFQGCHRPQVIHIYPSISSNSS